MRAIITVCDDNGYPARDTLIEINQEKVMSDTFRKEYKELHPAVTAHIAVIKQYAEDLENVLNKTEAICNYDKRQMALAKTNLEQAIMWAVKAIT